MIKKWLPLIIVGTAIIIFWLSGLSSYVSLEQFHAHKYDLRDYVSARPWQSIMIYAVIYITITTLSLPIASLLTLIGGFLFGVVTGTILVTVSATIGATILFLIAKSSLGKTLRDKAGKLYHRVDEDMRDNAFSYLLTLRLIPLFPFFLVNILPALFDIKPRTYVAATFLGIIPGTAIYVNAGRQLGEIESLSELKSNDTLLAIGLLALIILLPTFYKKFRKVKSV